MTDQAHEMSQTLFFIKLMLVHCATQSRIETHCNGDVLLKCTDVDPDTMNFMSLTWYKLHNHKKRGIIRRDKGDKETHYYNFIRPALFGEKYSLLLSGATHEDSGRYECAINANIRGQNLKHEVDLIVNVCTTQANLMTTSQSEEPSHNHSEDLPVMWTFIAYGAVGLTKIILSLITIWVIQAVRNRSSRRWQHDW